MDNSIDAVARQAESHCERLIAAQRQQIRQLQDDVNALKAATPATAEALPPWKAIERRLGSRMARDVNACVHRRFSDLNVNLRTTIAEMVRAEVAYQLALIGVAKTAEPVESEPSEGEVVDRALKVTAP